MIDIHCHIIPAMDDGPDSLDEALAMCRAAVADGVKTIVATPHFKPGTYEFDGPGLRKRVGTLKSALKRAGVDITILPGAEIAAFPELPSYLSEDNYLTLNNNGNYFLIEFSPLSVPPNWDNFLYSFLPSGKVPIIAHPERNDWFLSHPDMLSAAVQKGLMVQITAASLAGYFGSEPRDFCVLLLRRNLVHVIGSDGHSGDLRPPLLSEAVRLAADVVGEKRAEALVTTLPQAIIEGKNIQAMGPTEYSFPVRGQMRSWLQRLKHM